MSITFFKLHPNPHLNSSHFHHVGHPLHIFLNQLPFGFITNPLLLPHQIHSIIPFIMNSKRLTAISILLCPSFNKSSQNSNAATMSYKNLNLHSGQLTVHHPIILHQLTVWPTTPHMTSTQSLPLTMMLPSLPVHLTYPIILHQLLLQLLYQHLLRLFQYFLHSLLILDLSIPPSWLSSTPMANSFNNSLNLRIPPPPYKKPDPYPRRSPQT